MATKTGNDLEALRALLDEVKALREGVETQRRGAQARLGRRRGKGRVQGDQPFALHRAARPRPQRPAAQARGARALLARPERGQGRSDPRRADRDAAPPDRRGRRPLPWPGGRARERVGAGGRSRSPVRQAAQGRPAGAGDGDPAARKPRQSPKLVDNLVAAGMDCARINCAHDDAEAWGRMVENVREASARHERPCKILMDLGGPKCRILRVKAPPKTRLARGDRATLVDELKEKTRDPIAFSLNFPETRRPARDRRGGVHRRRQGGGARDRQDAGPGRDRGLRLARQGRAAEARQGRQLPLDRDSSCRR